MIFAAAALIMLSVFFGARAVLVPRRNLAAEQLARVGAGAPAREDDEESTTVVDRVMRPIVNGLAGRVGGLLPSRVTAHFSEQLIAAGRPANRGAFLASLVLMPSVFALLGVLLVIRTGRLSPLTILAAVVVLGGFGLASPVIWLRGRVTRRQMRINRDLPDMLDLVVVSVEAGLGLEGAIGRVAESKTGPLAEEFRRVLADMNLGLGRRRAMQALAQRTQVASVQTLVAAMIQAEQTGMGIGQILRMQSEQLRTQRRQHAEETAMKAPLKMLFPLVMFIFPSLFVVVLGPAVINFMDVMKGA